MQGRPVIALFPQGLCPRALHPRALHLIGMIRAFQILASKILTFQIRTAQIRTALFFAALVLVGLLGLASPPALGQATPQSIARRIMDVCVVERYAQGVARDRIAPQCRCAAELATKQLGFRGISERPLQGQKLTTRQAGSLDNALAQCQDAGLDETQTPGLSDGLPSQ